MSGTISDRVALFVPGRPSSEQAWMEALGRVGLRVEGGVLRGEPLDSSVQIEWVANAGGFGDAFSFGNVRREVVQVVDACAFALVLRFSVDLREGRREIGELVTRLREAGAVGVRLEQSKLGWEISDWLALMTSDDAWSWHRATIVVLNGEGALQSCGMHAFSLPDVRIETAGGDPDVLQELASVFNAYQLAEAPLLLSGQTFSPDPDTPRRVLERWPDIDYPLNHVCHNPYGVWRLGPPGERGRPQSKLAPTFMPSLVATLLALEKKAGKPLTRQQVEAARDEHPCITLEQRDAQRMERARGSRPQCAKLASLIRSSNKPTSTSVHPNQSMDGGCARWRQARDGHGGVADSRQSGPGAAQRLHPLEGSAVALLVERALKDVAKAYEPPFCSR